MDEKHEDEMQIFKEHLKNQARKFEESHMEIIEEIEHLKQQLNVTEDEWDQSEKESAELILEVCIKSKMSQNPP